MLLVEKLVVRTILFVNNDDLLTIQKVLVPLASIGVVRIGKVSLDILSIYHLYILSLTKLNLMLLLLQSRLLVFVQLVGSTLQFLRYLLLLALVLDEISSFGLDWLRVGLGHVPGVRPDKRTRLRKPRIVPISKLIKRALREVYHVLIHLLLLLISRGKHLHKAGAYHVVILVPLRLQLLPLSIPLLLCHDRILVLPPIELLSLIFLHLLLTTLTQIQQRYGLKYHIVLYLLVEGTICGERCQAVDLYEPGFDLVIDEDVDAEDLEADGVFHVVGLQ